MNKNRVVIFLSLAAGLLLGIYLNWPMISRDMTRLEPWKVPLLWIGDVFALLFAFQWMLKQEEDPSSEYLPSHFRSTFNAKMVVFLIAGSFLFDIAVTGYALWDSKQAMKRAIVAEATIRSTREVVWAGKAVHYTVDAEFDDRQQRSHHVSLKFTDKLNEQRNQWLIDATNTVKKGQGGLIEIVSDPIWPQRAWVAGQPWGATSSISVIFSLIHILQTIAIAAGIDDILKSRGSQTSRLADRVRLYPLVCEVCLLVLFGLLLSQ